MVGTQAAGIRVAAVQEKAPEGAIGEISRVAGTLAVVGHAATKTARAAEGGDVDPTE